MRREIYEDVAVVAAVFAFDYCFGGATMIKAVIVLLS